MKFFVKKFKFFFFSFLFIYPLFAEEPFAPAAEIEDETFLLQSSEPLPLRDFLFSVSLYSLTGKKESQSAAGFAQISRQASSFLMLKFYNWQEKKLTFLYEIYYPEKKGLISPKDIVSVKEIILKENLEENVSGGTFSFDDENMQDSILELLENSDDDPVPVEKDVWSVFRKKDGSLRKFIFNDESLSLNKVTDSTFTVKAYDDSVIRKYFTGDGLVSKIQYFNNPKTADDFLLKKETEFFYDEKGMLYRTCEENFQKKTREESFYDENSRLVKKIDFHYETVVSENEGETETGKEKLELKQDSVSEWTYSQEGNLLSYRQEKRELKKNYLGKENTSVTETLTQYIYGSNSEKPDVLYYENGSLRKETLFKDELNYTEVLYIDGGFKIEAEFCDGIKKMETVFSGDKLLRRKYYGQD